MHPKIELMVVLALACLGLGGCVSRNSGPAMTPDQFIAATPGVEGRAAVIRAGNPKLSREQAMAQAAAESAASRERLERAKADKQHAAQKAFEEDLAKTLAAEGR
jgi:hypothetical protein